MKTLIIISILLLCSTVSAQTYKSLDTIQPGQNYDNVMVRKIAEDSLQSSFIIWIKKDVKGHFHNVHTENIVILEGKAEMMFNGEKIIVKKGDYLNIPKGTHHSVEKILSRKALKVLSIQSPSFDGKDRIFIEERD